MAASSPSSRSLCFLILALLATVAHAGTFYIYDRWSYVSGTAVTWGGPLQSDVWHDATTRPLVVKLTLASFFSSGTSTPITAQASKKFIRLSSSAKFITVVGTTPQGGPVTTGFQVGAPQYYDYDASTDALAAIPASIEFLITFDSKTTDIAGTTFKLSYDCGALNNDPSLVDTGSCISSRASGGTPGFQTVKIGWVPVISIHEVTGSGSSATYEDVTGQWIDLGQVSSGNTAALKTHVVRFAPQSGKQIFTGTGSSAPNGFFQNWNSLSLSHIFGRPDRLQLENEGVKDAWNTYTSTAAVRTISNGITTSASVPVTLFPPLDVAFKGSYSSFKGSFSTTTVNSVTTTTLTASSVFGTISVGQVITWLGAPAGTFTISTLVNGKGGAGTYTIGGYSGADIAVGSEVSVTGLIPDAGITPKGTSTATDFGNVFNSGTKVFLKSTQANEAINFNPLFETGIPVKKVSLPTTTYCEVKFQPTSNSEAGDYDVVISSMAFLRAGDFAPSAQTVFNVKSGFRVSPGFYETSAFDVKDAWFPSDKAISLRVSTPLGPTNADSLSTASGVYPNKYLVASYDIAPADTSTKYGIAASNLLFGMPSLPAGITGGNNEQIADKNYQTLGADSTKQVWYQYALATSGVAPGKYEFKIAQGSLFAATLKAGSGVGTGGCVNDASGICKCTDISGSTQYTKLEYTRSPYIDNKFDTHHLFAGDGGCRGIMSNARASADLKIGFVPTVKILEGTPPAKTTDLDTRFDVTSDWLNLESQCAFPSPSGDCSIPEVPHALVITPPTGYSFDLTEISSGPNSYSLPTPSTLLPWVRTGTYASGASKILKELFFSEDYASRSTPSTLQRRNDYWEIPFLAVPVADYKPGAYSVIVESNKIKRKEDDASVEVRNARTVIVVRAGFDTDIHFVDSAPAPYLQDTDRWFLNTNTNIKLEIKAGRLPSGISETNTAKAPQFVLAPDLAATFLPLANLQQSATSVAYRIPGYGIESGRALGGMSALPGNIGSTTTTPITLVDEKVKYALTLTDVEPGYYQFNISSGAFLRIVGRDYTTGFYNGATLNGVTLDSSLKLGYMLQNEPRVCPGACFSGACSTTFVGTAITTIGGENFLTADAPATGTSISIGQVLTWSHASVDYKATVTAFVSGTGGAGTYKISGYTGLPSSLTANTQFTGTLSPSNADINRANLILSQSTFCAPGVNSHANGLAGAVYSTTNAVKTTLTDSSTPSIKPFNNVNTNWWGGRVLKDQLQVFNYQKSHVLNVGFSLDYSIKDAATKQIVTLKAGSTETLSWLNPNNDHEITFTAGEFDSYPQTFSVSTLATPPVEEKLIDAYQVPANVKKDSTFASFTGSIVTNFGTNVATLTTSSVTGTIAVGQTIRGTGVPSGMRVKSGSGNTWVVERPVTASFTGVIASDGVLTISGSVTGTIVIGQEITWADAPAGIHTIDGYDTANGKYTTSLAAAVPSGTVFTAILYDGNVESSFKGNIATSSNVPELTVTDSTTTGTIVAGQYIYGDGVDEGTRIVPGSAATGNGLIWNLELTSSFTGLIAYVIADSAFKLTVTSNTLFGTIKADQVISGTGVPEGTKIATGSSTSPFSLVLPSATGFTGALSNIVGLTATLTVTGTIASGDKILVGHSLSWAANANTNVALFAIAGSLKITSQLTITGGSTAGKLGTYLVTKTGGSMPTDTSGGVVMDAEFHTDFTVGTAQVPIAMTGLGGAIADVTGEAITGSVPVTIPSAQMTTSAAQYILNPSVPSSITSFCGTPSEIVFNRCPNAQLFFKSSLFSESAFLLPKGSNVDPLSKDESRITYTLQAEPKALTGEYKILVPEGAFTREHTLAKNIRQVITVKVGHGLKIDFNDWIDGTAAVAQFTAIGDPSFGTQPTWFNAQKFDDAALKLSIAHSSLSSNIHLTSSAPLWSSLFPVEKPGVSVNLPEGIIGSVWAPTSPAPGIFSYALSNINDLEPGTYRFDIPNGYFTENTATVSFTGTISGTTLTIASTLLGTVQNSQRITWLLQGSTAASPSQAITTSACTISAAGTGSCTVSIATGGTMPTVSTAITMSGIKFRTGDKRSVGSTSDDQSIASLEIKNYAYTIYLKIGFPSYVDFIDGNDVSLMTFTSDLKALSFSSEYLSRKRTTATARAIINTQTTEQTMAIYNTVLNNAVTSTTAFGAITSPAILSFSTLPSVDVSLRGGLKPSTNDKTSQFFASYVIAGPITAGSFTVSVKNGAFCTQKASDCSFDANGVIPPNCICNAPTHSSEISNVKFAANDVGITIASSDDKYQYSTSLVSGALPYSSPQLGSGLQYNVFDPDFRYVQVMPIFTSQLKIKFTFTGTSATIASASAAWSVLIDEPEGFPAPTTTAYDNSAKFVTFSWAVNTLIPGTWDLVLKPSSTINSPRSRIRLVIGPNPVFYKLDKETQLIPRAPGGPFATNVNSLYLSIGGTKYRKSGAGDIGCELKLSDILLVRDSINNDVTKAVTIDDTPDVKINTRNQIPGAELKATFTGSISMDTLVVSSVTGTIATGQVVTRTSGPSGFRIKSGTGPYAVEKSISSTFSGDITTAGVFTPTSLTGAVFFVGQEISWTDAPAGTHTITGYGSTDGTYTLSTTTFASAVPASTAMSGFGYAPSGIVSSFKGAIVAGSNVLDVTTGTVSSTASLAALQYIYGSGVAVGTRIKSGSSLTWALELTSSFSGTMARTGTALVPVFTLTATNIRGTIKADQVITGSGLPTGGMKVKTVSGGGVYILEGEVAFTGSLDDQTSELTFEITSGSFVVGQVITWSGGDPAVALPSAAITISNVCTYSNPEMTEGTCPVTIASGTVPDVPDVTDRTWSGGKLPTASITQAIAMTGLGGDVGTVATAVAMTASIPSSVSSETMSSSHDFNSYDTLQSSAPTFRLGLDGLTDGEYTFVIGGDLSLTPQSDALTAYNARALTAMARCYDASALYATSTSTIQSGTSLVNSLEKLGLAVTALIPDDDNTATTKNIYASSSFKRGLKFNFTVDRVKPTPKSITYNDASPTCRDPSDSSTCIDLGPIYTTSPSGEIILPPTLFSDEGTPNEYLRVSVNSEDDRGIKLVRQYHGGPRNSVWPSGSLATDPLTLTTTVLTTSSANVRDPAGNAVFMVNATDEAGNWAEASFTIPIIKRSSGVLTAIDKRNVQSKSTLYTGSPDSLTSGNLKLVIVADFDVSVSGLTKDNLQCIAGNTPCFSGVSPVTMTASPGGKRFTFNFDVASTFITQGKLITISILMSRTDGSTTTTVLSVRDKYEIAAPSPVYVSIDKTAVVPVMYVAPYRAVVNTKYTLVLPSKLFYDDVSTPKKIKLLTATPTSQFGLTFSSDLQGNATITGIPLAQPTTAYDNRVTFTIRGQDEAGNVDKEVNVYIGIHAAEETKPSLTVLGSLLQFNEKDDDATISSGDAIPSSKLINFDSAATFTSGTGQKFAAVYAYLTRPEPNEERDVGVSCSTTRSSAITWFSTALFSTPITQKNSLSLVSRLGYSASGYPYTNDYCRWERLRTSSTFTAPSGSTVSSYSVDPLTGEGRIGLESCKKSPTFIGTLDCQSTCTLIVISGTVPTPGQVITWTGAPNGVHTVGSSLVVTSTGTLVAVASATTMTIVDIPCAPGFSSTTDSTNCRGTAKYRDSEVEPEVCTPGLDAATIQSWIRSLQYVNERTDVTNGNRIIRVDVWSPGHIAVGKRIDALGNLVTSLVGGDRPGFGVAASASRTLRVAAVNNAPRVTVHPTAIWIEKGDPVPVLDQGYVWGSALTTSQVRITDMDDNDVTAAYVQIATSTDPSTAAEGPAYAGCDKTRDRLFLGTDYLDSSSKASSSPATARGTLPKVIASWSSASCTLTLIPTAPLTRVTKEDMTIALLSIKYTNDDYYNPVNFDDGTTKNNHGRVRMISVKVDDAANQGKLADRKSNDLLAAKPTNQVYLFLQCYDDVPVVNVRRIFGIGGILSSTNSYANILTTYDMDGVVKIKAFPLLTPPIYDQDGNTVEIKSQTVTPYQLEFDLTQVKDANGNVVPGLFAKGQIYDLDSTAPPTSPETDGPIDIKFFFDTDAPAAFSSGTETKATNDVVTLRNMAKTLFGNSNNGPNPSNEKCKTCVFYVNPGSGEPVWTDPVTKTYYKTGFVYSSTGPSVLTIILNNNVPLSRLGAYTLQLQFGYVNNAQVLDSKLTTRPSFWPPSPGSTKVDSWSAAKFYIDVRQQACIDASASRASAEKSTTETNILNRINADTSATGLLVELTGAATALTSSTRAIHFPKFFPENSLCSYEPVSVIASSGLSYAVSRNNYNEVKNSLENSLAALKATGASVESQALALKDLRNQARGAFFVNIPAGSLASRGSMDFSATKVGASSISLLPALKTSAIESYDTDVAVRLQPAGTTFSEPVQVCIFAGDTPVKHFKYLSMASQKDPGDPSKGYLYWETLSGQSFNPATGEVCGKTDHFTVFAPVTRPTQESATIDKAHLMGGSCPNQCSGQGTCRQQGQCVCFAGFEGYDCSMRTCPSAESWGQDQEVMHTQSECAGRGLCQRTTGTCSCFDGFEGAACERATCPNDCNGHGKCRTLAELPKVQQYGYSSWEVKRIQKCLCDGGFSGADCSQRYCPFGDDPETICRYQDRQVQRFTLDFYTDPTGTGRPDVDSATDQFALIFTSVSGTNYTTPMIDNIWEGTPESSTAVKNALLTLPEFAVMGVEVSAVPTDSGSLSVSYDLTFTGLTNTGNEFLLSCPYNSLGSTGCPAPGCRPKFNQLRILKAPYLPPSVLLSPLSVLQQPKPLGSSALDNDELTPNVFGVEITLVINKYFMPGTTTLVYTYSFVNTKVYGQAADASGENKAVTFIETPFPPMKLRSSIPGPYGILFEFGSDTQLGIDFSGSGPFTFSFGWRLPSCSVSVVQYAAKEQEKAECSNRGICNRQSGECECFDGYAGFSCAQQTVYI